MQSRELAIPGLLQSRKRAGRDIQNSYEQSLAKSKRLELRVSLWWCQGFHIPDHHNVGRISRYGISDCNERVT